MDSNLGEALRSVRAFHEISQIELADELGISRSYLSELEGGHKTPSMDLLRAYADYFELPISSLLLFSESISAGRIESRIRKVAADKTVALLDWIQRRKIRRTKEVA